MHRAANGTCLLGHQDMAQHRIGGSTDLFGRACDADTTLAVGVISKATGTASTCVDLRLHDVDGAWKLAGGCGASIWRPRNKALRHRHPIVPQQLLRLVFVDVHARTDPLPPTPSREGRWGIEVAPIIRSGSSRPRPTRARRRTIARMRPFPWHSIRPEGCARYLRPRSPRGRRHT